MNARPVLQLQDVSRIYRQGDQEVRALDHFSLELAAGDFAAVAGPSGSGKTTLLNLAAGLDRSDGGRIFLDGREVTALSRAERAALRREKIGFIFQSFNLVPVLSARENAEFVLLLRGMDAPERRRRVDEVLQEVGLEGLEDRRPSQLSGGQQQRVAVARAIVGRPALVLADEPTANLDTETALSLLDLMERLNRVHGTTFLFSTHDPRVMQRAGRLIRLLDGRLESDRLQTPAAADARIGEG